MGKREGERKRGEGGGGGEGGLEVWMNSEIVGGILLIAKTFGRGRTWAAAQFYRGRVVMGEQNC